MLKEMVMENTMEQRVETLNSILEEEGADFRIEYVRTWKNNCELEGYILKSDEHNCCPTIYFGNWFEEDDEVVAAYLMDLYSEHAADYDIRESVSRDYLLANVLPRLVAATNLEGVRSRNLVSIPYLDMLITFAVPIKGFSSEGYTGAIQVTEMLLNSAQISVDEIHKAALANLDKDIQINTIADVLSKMMGSEFDCFGCEIPMLVVGNSTGVNGAAAMLSKKTLETLVDMVGGKVAILPSSVHECIALPCSEMDSLQGLINMVKTINADPSIMQAEDILTNNVYVYENGKLTALE